MKIHSISEIVLEKQARDKCSPSPEWFCFLNCSVLSNSKFIKKLESHNHICLAGSS